MANIYLLLGILALFFITAIVSLIWFFASKSEKPTPIAFMFISAMGVLGLAIYLLYEIAKALLILYI